MKSTVIEFPKTAILSPALLANPALRAQHFVFIEEGKRLEREIVKTLKGEQP